MGTLVHKEIKIHKKLQPLRFRPLLIEHDEMHIGFGVGPFRIGKRISVRDFNGETTIIDDEQNGQSISDEEQYEQQRGPIKLIISRYRY